MGSAPRPKSFNVWLHIINTCNFRCHYCYLPELGKEVDPLTIERLSIRTESVFPILDRLISFCERSKIERLHIKFAGGEPTLNIPLLELFCSAAASICSNVRVSFGIISNGSFKPQELVPLLRKHNFTISISVDGFEASHDRVRFTVDSATGRRTGSWTLIDKNIGELVAEGIRPYFLFTATRQNCAELIPFSSYCHSKGLGFRISLVRGSLQPSPSILDQISANVCELYRHLGTSMPLNLRLERDAKFAEWNLAKKKMLACGSCRNYVAIDQEGRVSSCQMSFGHSHGNLLDSDLETITASMATDPRTATLANPQLRIGPCMRCRYAHVCAGGCPQHTMQAFSTFDHVSPWCAAFGQIVPVYIEAAARHLLRKYLATREPQPVT